MSSKARIIIVLAVVVVIGLLLFVLRMGETGEGMLAGFDEEFMVREDGYPGLIEHYDFEFSRAPRQMDPALMYRAAADGAVDVICAFATDGRIPAYDLAVLEDDLQFFPPYYAAPLIRRDTLEEHPELEDILNMLSGTLDDEKMQELNYRADEEKVAAAEVAMEFLRETGIIGPDDEPGDGSAGRIAIGSKHFTEQEILGEMLAALIEHKSDIQVRRRLNLGGTMVCFQALTAGDLDLYAEYTGTGLVNILDMDVIEDPDEAFNVVKEEFADQYDLVWLEPFGFNNTYTLTMRRDHAEELGISTISDLAEYVRTQEEL